MAAKALFRAGDIEAAEKMAALFTRDGDQANNLNDMQCMWYEMEAGNAHLRRRAYGPALKKFLAVGKHFADFQEDQFDFHSYCVRQMTVRTYISMLRMEDNLYNKDIYIKAAQGAVQAYLALYDMPSRKREEEESEEAKMATMSAEERKKYKQKKRKEQLRLEKAAAEKEAAAREAASKEAATASKDKNGKRVVAAKDPDPDGAQLAANPDPLGEASKLIRTLKTHADSRFLTHLLAFEVYLRKRKFLLALQALTRALQLEGSDHPEVHPRLIRYSLAFQALSGDLASPAANSHSEGDPKNGRRCWLLRGRWCGRSSKKSWGKSWGRELTWMSTTRPGLPEQANASVSHRVAAAETLCLLRACRAGACRQPPVECRR
eukprot:jgi/Botrbrau1/16275/Bobra.0066s0056.1